jgi:hypothetical protein
MSDESTSIPLVKISGELIKAPSPDNFVHEDVVVAFELVNLGTGPTTAADQVWVSAGVDRTVFAQQSENLDSPPIEPNGGSRRFRFVFDGHHFFADDRFYLWVAVTNAAGETSDEQTSPAFSVRHPEGHDAVS